MVSHRDADKQASRWDDFLSSFVRGSKGFSPLSRLQISLCDEKANMLRSESYFKTKKNKKIFTLTVA